MRVGRRVGGLVAAVAFWGAGGTAGAEEWEKVLEKPWVVKTREADGAGVKEYRVEGKLAASVADLEATLCDTASFPSFMPHVKEARVLRDVGKVTHVYVRVAPPVGDNRDYISEVRLLESSGPEGSGSFRQTWRAVPDYLPTRRGIIRLKVNEGSWDISPAGEAESHVVYRFRVDPGGWVPGFIREMANRDGIPDTLRAIEREAQRRGRERLEAARLPPAPR